MPIDFFPSDKVKARFVVNLISLSNVMKLLRHCTWLTFAFCVKLVWVLPA